MEQAHNRRSWGWKPEDRKFKVIDFIASMSSLWIQEILSQREGGMEGRKGGREEEREKGREEGRKEDFNLIPPSPQDRFCLMAQASP